MASRRERGRLRAWQLITHVASKRPTDRVCPSELGGCGGRATSQAIAIVPGYHVGTRFALVSGWAAQHNRETLQSPRVVQPRVYPRNMMPPHIRNIRAAGTDRRGGSPTFTCITSAPTMSSATIPAATRMGRSTQMPTTKARPEAILSPPTT